MQPHVPEAIDPNDRHLLMRVAAGMRIVDLAEELGYSERTMYRMLARLWEQLGVEGRSAGLLRASDEGLLNLGEPNLVDS